MRAPHSALILIAVDLMAGVDRLKRIAQEMEDIGKIVSSSSVYKRYLNLRSEDLNSELVVVIKLETKKTDQEVFHFLKGKEKSRGPYQTAASEAFLLLAYDQITRMVPGQNLPNPIVHTDPLTLRCAAEAWGSYEHPVLGQMLNELVRSGKSLTNVEFFSQFTLESR